VDLGVGFDDRAAVVVAVGFLRIYGFYSRIGIAEVIKQPAL